MAKVTIIPSKLNPITQVTHTTLYTKEKLPPMLVYQHYKMNN